MSRGHLAAKPPVQLAAVRQPHQKEGQRIVKCKTGRLVNAAKGAQLVFQFQAAVAPDANCGEQIKVLHNPFASFGCLCRNNRLVRSHRDIGREPQLGAV